MTNPVETILIANDKDNLTTQEKAICSRLTEAMRHRVTVEGVQFDLAKARNVGLIVICAGHVPGEFRKLEIPILVCNPFALYDLGMTMGKEGTDFGIQRYSSVFIRPEAIGEPLPTGIMERRQVTDEQMPQGWARPSAKALVVATVGGDSTKPVAFSYEKADAMPGMDAAHRRGAFLPTGDASGQLKPEGWMLFDVAVTTLIEGNRWADRPGPVGLWFLKDGSPTRSMAADEYRAWVHDQVSDDLFKRLTFRGFVSVTVIIGLITSFWGILQWQIQSKVEAEMKNTAGTIRDQLRKDLDQQGAKQMVDIAVGQDSPIWKEVRKKIEKTANDNIDNAIKNDPNIRQQVENVVVPIVNGKIGDTAILQYKQTKAGDNSKKRSLLLRLAFVYATEAQEATLREIVKTALTDEDEYVRATALDNFQPSDAPEEAKKELDKILPLFDFKKSSPAIREAYATLIARFYDDQSDSVLDWLRKNDNLYAANSRDLLTGVARMKKRDEANPRVFDQLVDFTVSGDEQKSIWGARALSLLMKDNFKLNINKKARQDAFEKLAKELNTRSPAKGQFIFDTIDLKRTDLTSSILIAMFGPEEESYIAGKIGSGPRSDSRAVQALLFNFAVRLEKENKKVPDAVATQLFTVSDLLAGEGTARLLTRAIQQDDARYAQMLLEGLPNSRPEALPDVKTHPAAAKAMLAAIEADARREPPFQVTTALWRTLASKDAPDPKSKESQAKDEKLTKIRDYLMGAFESYCKAYGRQLTDLTRLQRTYETIEPELRSLFKLEFIEALDGTVIRQARDFKKWDVEIAAHECMLHVYGQLVEHEADPAKVDQLNLKRAATYYNRGEAHYSQLRQYSHAAGDYSKAIDLLNGVLNKSASTDGPASKAAIDLKTKLDMYYYELGNSQSGMGNVDKAIESLTKVIDPEAKGYNDIRGNAHKQLALAYIFKKDRANAELHVEGAVAAYASAQKKAGAKENKGLLYLRIHEWKAALDNTEDARSFYSSSPWNWIIRYIAAKEAALEAMDAKGKAKYEAIADDAKQNWEKLGVPNDLSNLSYYIPDLLQKHLGLVPQRVFGREASVIVDRLLASTAEPKAKDFAKTLAKIHTLGLKGGKTYIIDMESTALDAYLILLNGAGKEVARDDDSGGARNARIFYHVEKDADFQLIATSFEGGAQGAYSVIVREFTPTKK